MIEDSWTGRQLGNFKIIKQLGCGSIGTVYQAIHTIYEKEVCLKILFDTLVLEAGKDFARQGKSVTALDHPNIVRVYSVQREKDTLYIAMEYIQGKTLPQILEIKDAFNVKETLEIAGQIAQALKFAYEHGIVHGDLKPENIMLCAEQEVKVSDFGLARFIDFNKGNVPGELGTSLYLAPEYIRGDSPNTFMDMYSFGITLFQMLAGDPPYMGKTPGAIIAQHLCSAPPPKISEWRADVPGDVEKLIKKLMEKDAGDRFISFSEVLHAIDRCLKNLAGKRTQDTERLTPAILQLDQEQEKREKVQSDKIRVLVVEDSLSMSKAVCRMLEKDPAIEVAGTAYDGEQALKKIPKLAPDVVTLDFNMPVMDGLTTLKHIMASRPVPVVMLSSFTYEGALPTFECLSCGAVDFAWKSPGSQLKELGDDLRSKVKKASRMQLFVPTKSRTEFPAKKSGIDDIPARWVVVMGGGHGGYHVYLKIIPYLSKNIPCAVIAVQEMPDEIIQPFTGYLDRHSRVSVREAVAGKALSEGVCYLTNHLSPLSLMHCGDSQGFEFRGQVVAPAEKSVFFQLLSSAADRFGFRTIAVQLSGDIPDAGKGLEKVKSAGGMVIVQDPATCLEPKTARLFSGKALADKTVADIDIPSVLLNGLKRKKERSDTGKKKLLQIASSTKRIKPSSMQSSTIILVSGQISAVNLQDCLQKYQIVSFPSLPELKSYLKLYSGRVILDSDYLGYYLINYLDFLRQEIPETCLLVLADACAEIGDPEPLLSLPYNKDEAKLGRLLLPYLTSFYFQSGRLTLKLIVFLAKKAKWTVRLSVNEGRTEHGTIVLRKGEIVQSRYKKLQGRESLQFFLDNDYSWKISEAAPKDEEIEALLDPKGNIQDHTRDFSLLIVDADTEVRQLLTDILEKQGYRLTFAKDAIEALLYLGKEKFDLILSEIALSNLDGFQLLEKKSQNGIDTPLIFLTARDDKNSVLKALQLGVADYIKKPIKQDLLLTRIKNVLARTAH